MRGSRVVRIFMRAVNSKCACIRLARLARTAALRRALPYGAEIRKLIIFIGHLHSLVSQMPISELEVAAQQVIYLLFPMRVFMNQRWRNYFCVCEIHIGQFIIELVWHFFVNVNNTPLVAFISVL